jgi:hypothetical protein
MIIMIIILYNIIYDCSILYKNTKVGGRDTDETHIKCQTRPENVQKRPNKGTKERSQ